MTRPEAAVLAAIDELERDAIDDLVDWQMADSPAAEAEREAILPRWAVRRGSWRIDESARRTIDDLNRRAFDAINRARARDAGYVRPTRATFGCGGGHGFTVEGTGEWATPAGARHQNHPCEIVPVAWGDPTLPTAAARAEAFAEWQRAQPSYGRPSAAERFGQTLGGMIAALRERGVWPEDADERAALVEGIAGP